MTSYCCRSHQIRSQSVACNHPGTHSRTPYTLNYPTLTLTKGQRSKVKGHLAPGISLLHATTKYGSHVPLTCHYRARKWVFPRERSNMVTCMLIFEPKVVSRQKYDQIWSRACSFSRQKWFSRHNTTKYGHAHTPQMSFRAKSGFPATTLPNMVTHILLKCNFRAKSGFPATTLPNKVMHVTFPAKKSCSAPRKHSERPEVVLFCIQSPGEDLCFLCCSFNFSFRPSMASFCEREVHLMEVATGAKYNPVATMAHFEHALSILGHISVGQRPFFFSRMIHDLVVNIVGIFNFHPAGPLLGSAGKCLCPRLRVYHLLSNPIFLLRSGIWYSCPALGIESSIKARDTGRMLVGEMRLFVDLIAHVSTFHCVVLSNRLHRFLLPSGVSSSLSVCCLPSARSNEERRDLSPA